MSRAAGSVGTTTRKLSVVRFLDDRNVISAMRDELPVEWRTLDVITTDRLLSGDLSNGQVKNGGIRFAAYGEPARILAKHFLYTHRVQTGRLTTRSACLTAVMALKLLMPILDAADGTVDQRLLEDALTAHFQAKGLDLRYSHTRSMHLKEKTG